jgi:hypothetical protein
MSDDDQPIDPALLPLDPDQAERIGAYHWMRGDAVREADPDEAARMETQAAWYRRAAAQLRRTEGGKA